MNKKRHLLGGLLFAALMVGTPVHAESARGKAARPSQPAKETPVHLQDVDPSNGIDANEARAIADAYFEQEYGACGGPDDMVLNKGTWVFSLLFGVAGDRLKETIKVDAKTGGVRSEGGPRYADFESFRMGKALPAKKKQKQTGPEPSNSPLQSDGASRRR